MQKLGRWGRLLGVLVAAVVVAASPTVAVAVSLGPEHDPPDRICKIIPWFCRG